MLLKVTWLVKNNNTKTCIILNKLYLILITKAIKNSMPLSLQYTDIFASHSLANIFIKAILNLNVSSNPD